MSANRKKYFESTKAPAAKASVGPHYKAEYGFAMCSVCHAFYYKKSWHHNTDKLAPREARKLEIASTLCPADNMIKKNLYEGEIIIRNVPEKFQVELVNLIRGFGERAYKRDCQHRVSELKKQKSGFRVRTTENQLAVKLAKKIKSVFNKVELTTGYSKEPYEVVRITVQFKN